MKIRILSLFAVIFLLSVSHDTKAQAGGVELGVRFGEVVSIDATLPIAAAPRLHPAIYFDRFGVATYFDWMFQLDGAGRGFKFYPGVGPELWLGDEVDLGVGGNFGMQYSFDFPLTIAFDWRPSLILTEGDFTSNNWGFSARLRFVKGR